MGTLLKIEFTKLIKKKDVILISSLMIILPLIMALLFRFNVGGLTLQGQLAPQDYGMIVWSFLKMLFVLYIIPIYIPCTFIGREVEQRSINMLLSKEKRNNILLSKIIMSLAYITIFMVLFFIVSYAGFKIFLTGSEYELLDLTAATTASKYLMMYVLQWLEMIFVTLLAVLLNTVIKGNVALVLGFGCIAIEKALQSLDMLKSYVPTFISDFNNMVGMSNELFSKSVLIYIIYLFVLLFISFMWWKKREF